MTKEHAAADDHDVETKRSDSSRCYTNSDGKVKDDNTGYQRQSKTENSHKVNEDASGTLDSPNGSLGGRKSSSQLITGSKHVNGVCELGARTYSLDPKNLKVLVGKSSSETYKSSTSRSQSPRAILSLTTSSKHKGMLSDNVGSRRDDLSSDWVKDEGRIERSKRIKKDIPKSSINPFSKVSQSSRFSRAPVPKGRSSDPKASSLHSSPNVLPPKATNSLKNAGASAHNKVLSSGLPVKSEKITQADSQPSSKGNSSQNQPPASSNPPSGLSDEELALLLHKELNSSHRITRVPRMRHAGSFPQLTFPTAASMLMKRTSTSRGKDFSSSSRRKSKDSELSARNVSDEAKKVKRVSPTPDHRGKDSEITSTLTHGEGESGLPKNLVRKNKPPASTATTSSGLSFSAEVTPRNTSDGDSGAVGRPHTLPGVISKIMSKGERMELCDAVSPTSTSEKRSKPDADLSDDESEDNVRRERTTKEGRTKILVSQREELPEVKRQARKPRGGIT